MSLNANEINQLLARKDVMFLATVKPSNNAHLVPMWYVHKDGDTYFQTSNKSQKFKNITYNNTVSLCFGGRRTYIVEGEVEQFTTGDAPIDIRKELQEKYGKEMKDSYINQDTVVFKVTPHKTISWH